MHQDKVVVISKNIGTFVPLQKHLKENCIDVCTVSTFEDIFEKYMTLPFVLTIIDADLYGEDTLKLVRYLRGAKPVPILVMMTESCLYNRLDLLRMGATVCMDSEASSEEQAAQAKALIHIYNARDDNLHRETLVFETTLVINPIYHLVILSNTKRRKNKFASSGI